MTRLTARQEAEAIEQFGMDLIRLNRAFDELCRGMSSRGLDAVNAIPDQDKLSTIAGIFLFEGQRYGTECDHAEEAEDRRRDNPLEPGHRRLGQ